MELWAASTDDLLAFLQSEYTKSSSGAVVYQRMSSVSYFYRLKGLESPSHNPLVQMYLKGLKRRQLHLGGPVHRAKPLTKDQLAQLNDYLISGERSLREWRTIWRINLAFYCLLRWDDVCRLLVRYFHICSLCNLNFPYIFLLEQVTDFDLNNDDGLPCYDFELRGGKTLMHEKNLNRYEHLSSYTSIYVIFL